MYILLVAISFSILSHAESNDPLPSWRSGLVKQNIIHFVQAVTDKKSLDYVSPEDRIATFDNDGTLWVEKPIYPQFIFMMDRIKVNADKHPEWKIIEPYKSILNNNYQNLTKSNINILFLETSSGVTTDEYEGFVRQWLDSAKNPHYNRHYNELVFQPILEVMNYLRDNQFKVYIVSGGGQDFIRAYARNTYGVPSEHVIGTTTPTQYTFNDQKPELLKKPTLLFLCDKEGKVEAIHLFIGKKPIIAFGNSDGDRQMLEWTQSGVGKKLMLLVHHDDESREYAYDANSKVGTFSEALMKEANENNWQVISMKNDWEVLFPFEIKKR